MASPGPHSRFSARVGGTPASISEAAGQVMAIAEAHGYDKAARFAVRLAVEEALTNALRHGHKGLDPGTPVALDVEMLPDAMRIVVEDQGPGFDPAGVPDPTLDENLNRPCGRGLMLIRAYMTEVRHNQRGNRIEMTYQRPAP
ncbi:MAG: ATP-binding protein [Phycisphaerales bacterium]|nr:ATP-binding protein [Phycisphaerales bacterium]